MGDRSTSEAIPTWEVIRSPGCVSSLFGTREDDSFLEGGTVEPEPVALAAPLLLRYRAGSATARVPGSSSSNRGTQALLVGFPEMP